MPDLIKKCRETIRLYKSAKSRMEFLMRDPEFDQKMRKYYPDFDSVEEFKALYEDACKNIEVWENIEAGLIKMN